MNIWHDIDSKRVTPTDFLAVIEISRGSKKKYELDKETGFLILDRVLNTSMQYPCNYGFIPKTLSDDGDPLDVLVLCSEDISPMSMVKCYPIAVVEMIDHGFKDEKIIAVPFSDPFYNCYKSLEDLPVNVVKEIEHFFSFYKGIKEDEVTHVSPMTGKTDAENAIARAIEQYNTKFAK